MEQVILDLNAAFAAYRDEAEASIAKAREEKAKAEASVAALADQLLALKTAIDEAKGRLHGTAFEPSNN